MRGRIWLAAACAVVLAASHAPDGAVGLAVAVVGLALATASLVWAARRPNAMAGSLLGAAVLVALAAWPSQAGSRGLAWAWGLGLACAVGLLAIAPAGPKPPGRVPAGLWLLRHAAGLGVLLLVLAAFIAGNVVVRRFGGPEYAQGHEWLGPYGPLLGALPALAAAAALILLGLAVRRGPPAAGPVEEGP